MTAKERIENLLSVTESLVGTAPNEIEEARIDGQIEDAQMKFINSKMQWNYFRCTGVFEVGDYVTDRYDKVYLVTAIDDENITVKDISGGKEVTCFVDYEQFHRSKYTNQV